jgi:hypothetical protein
MSARVDDVDIIEHVSASTSKNMGFALLVGYTF